MSLYDTSALYNQNMSEKQQQRFLEFYRDVFKGYDIATIHDCSIGAGGSTLPLAKLGYQVSGSDLSENLLKKARENFKQHGFDVELFAADLRELGTALPRTYDCIISTGHSLPHVSNQDVALFIQGASAKLNQNGLLYIDIRNWDKILSEKPIFTARHPLVMSAEEHVSLYQIWKWVDDEAVDFVFVTSVDRNGKHVSTSYTYAPTYYPLKYKDYEMMLNQHGFEVKRCFDVDHIWMGHSEEGKTGVFAEDFDKIGWYAILAQKA